MSISENLRKIRSTLPAEVTLVAISKTYPNEALMEAYNSGQRVFGENKVQEMTQKWEDLPKDIEWHMVGKVQRNKVKYMAPYVHLIHAVDSLKLLKEIEKEAVKNERIIHCLLQIKIAEEDTKNGITLDEAKEVLQSSEYKEMRQVKIVGLMGMATLTENEAQVREEFSYLKTCFDSLKETCTSLEIISMGMSGDYGIALECGSNLVRIGSAIFGERNYN